MPRIPDTPDAPFANPVISESVLGNTPLEDLTASDAALFENVAYYYAAYKLRFLGVDRMSVLSPIQTTAPYWHWPYIADRIATGRYKLHWISSPSGMGLNTSSVAGLSTLLYDTTDEQDLCIYYRHGKGEQPRFLRVKPGKILKACGFIAGEIERNIGRYGPYHGLTLEIISKPKKIVEAYETAIVASCMRSDRSQVKWKIHPCAAYGGKSPTRCDLYVVRDSSGGIVARAVFPVKTGVPLRWYIAGNTEKVKRFLESKGVLRTNSNQEFSLRLIRLNEKQIVCPYLDCYNPFVGIKNGRLVVKHPVTKRQAARWIAYSGRNTGGLIEPILSKKFAYCLRPCLMYSGITQGVDSISANGPWRNTWCENCGRLLWRERVQPILAKRPITYTTNTATPTAEPSTTDNEE